MLGTDVYCNLNLQGKSNLGVDFVCRKQQLLPYILLNHLLRVAGQMLGIFAVM